LSDRYFGATLEEIQEIKSETSSKRDPKTLSPNQKAIYESIAFPRKLNVLYRVHRELMPDSSVRRILWSLRNDGLAHKTDNGKWFRC